MPRPRQQISPTIAAEVHDALERRIARERRPMSWVVEDLLRAGCAALGESIEADSPPAPAIATVVGVDDTGHEEIVLTPAAG